MTPTDDIARWCAAITEPNLQPEWFAQQVGAVRETDGRRYSIGLPSPFLGAVVSVDRRTQRVSALIVQMLNRDASLQAALTATYGQPTLGPRMPGAGITGRFDIDIAPNRAETCVLYAQLDPMDESWASGGVVQLTISAQKRAPRRESDGR